MVETIAITQVRRDGTPVAGINDHSRRSDDGSSLSRCRIGQFSSPTAAEQEDNRDAMHFPDARVSLVLLVASNKRPMNHFTTLLKGAGYDVAPASSVKEALQCLEREPISLVLLHEVAGTIAERLCKRVRAVAAQRQANGIPIIMLSERFDSDEIVQCFYAGADDCVTGPHLEARVLLARIRAALRSRACQAASDYPTTEETIRVGMLAIDPIKIRVYVNDQPLDLTRIQFHLLAAMARRPGWIFSHAQLRETIAGQGGNADERSVKSHISHLRQRLGPAAKQIENVRGLGYRLNE